MTTDERNKILMELINYEHTHEASEVYTKLFKFEQLNKTLAHYSANSKHIDLDEYKAEALAYCVETVPRIPVSFWEEPAKFVNYLNKSITNHFAKLSKYRATEIPIGCEVVESIHATGLNYEGFATVNPCQKFLTFVLNYAPLMLTNLEQLILIDIMQTGGNISEELRAYILAEISAKNPHNHKQNLFIKLRKLFKRWEIIETDDARAIYAEHFGALREDEEPEDIEALKLYSLASLFRRPSHAEALGLNREEYKEAWNTLKNKAKGVK